VIKAFCHKHFVVFSRKTPPLTISDVSQLAVRWPCSTGDSVGNNWLVAASGTKAIGSDSRFLPTPPAFDAPVRGFPSEYRHPVWYGNYQMVKKFLKDVYSFWHDPRTWQTHRWTDRQTPHDGIGRAYAQHRAAKRNSEIAHMKWNSSFLYVIADSLALLLLFVVVVVVVTVATEYLKTAWDTE